MRVGLTARQGPLVDARGPARQELVPSSLTQHTASMSLLSLHLSIFEATSLAGPLAFDLISSPALLLPLAVALAHLAHTALLVALDHAAPRNPAAVLLALRTLVAVLGILLSLSSDERWSAALVEADVLPTLVRTAMLSRRAAVEAPPPVPASLSASPVEGVKAEPPPSSESGGASGSEAGTDRSAAATAEEGARTRLVWDVLSLSLGVLANVLDAGGPDAGLQLSNFRASPVCRRRQESGLTDFEVNLRQA